MGWFLMNEGEQAKLQGFSSPLGDGLVPVCRNGRQSVFRFRPRVGMGWFLTNATKSVQAQYFRPRLGMGWFYIMCYLNFRVSIFVPTWGWVGSEVI